MPAGECPECGAVCHPAKSVKKITVTVDGEVKTDVECEDAFIAMLKDNGIYWSTTNVANAGSLVETAYWAYKLAGIREMTEARFNKLEGQVAKLAELTSKLSENVKGAHGRL
jgi:hypothetical protein